MLHFVPIEQARGHWTCQIGWGRVVGGGSLRSESNHGCDHYLFNAEADLFIPTLDRAPYQIMLDFWQSETFFTFYVRLLQRYFLGTLSTHA